MFSSNAFLMRSLGLTCIWEDKIWAPRHIHMLHIHARENKIRLLNLLLVKRIEPFVSSFREVFVFGLPSIARIPRDWILYQGFPVNSFEEWMLHYFFDAFFGTKSLLGISYK